MFWIYEFSTYPYISKYRHDNRNYANNRNTVIICQLWRKYDIINNDWVCTSVSNCNRVFTPTRFFIQMMNVTCLWIMNNKRLTYEKESLLEVVLQYVSLFKFQFIYWCSLMYYILFFLYFLYFLFYFFLF